MDIKGYEKMLSDDLQSLADEQTDPNQERIQKVRGPGYVKITVNQVYDMLMSQRFEEWYFTQFEHHVGSDEPTKNDILVDLRSMMS